MSDKMNEAIQYIAIKHGMMIGKDDPILILYTMNEKLLEENRKAQEDLLVRFKEEMERISSQWNDDAKEKAEKIINAALMASKDAMARLVQESTNETILVMKKVISDLLVEAQYKIQKAKTYSQFAFFLSIAILAAFCFLLFIMYI